jgi:hypothetical protein
MMMSSIAGKIISTSGKRILMVVFWADSSACKQRRERMESEIARSAGPIAAPSCSL